MDQPAHRVYRYSPQMVVELDLSPDCEAALLAAARQSGLTVDETVRMAVEAFVNQQDLDQWGTEAKRNVIIHAEALRRLGE